MSYQSNALWPEGVCSSKWGDNISTDTHDTVEQSAGVCRGLKREGFGGERKVFPLFVWSSKVQQPPVLPKDWNWAEPPGYYDSAEARRPLPAEARHNAELCGGTSATNAVLNGKT